MIYDAPEGRARVLGGGIILRQPVVRELAGAGADAKATAAA